MVRSEAPWPRVSHHGAPVRAVAILRDGCTKACTLLRMRTEQILTILTVRSEALWPGVSNHEAPIHSAAILRYAAKGRLLRMRSEKMTLLENGENNEAPIRHTIVSIHLRPL